jgi:hypothetical protein
MDSYFFWRKVWNERIGLRELRGVALGLRRAVGTSALKTEGWIKQAQEEPVMNEGSFRSSRVSRGGWQG